MYLCENPNAIFFIYPVNCCVALQLAITVMQVECGILKRCLFKPARSQAGVQLNFFFKPSSVNDGLAMVEQGENVGKPRPPHYICICAEFFIHVKINLVVPSFFCFQFLSFLKPNPLLYSLVNTLVQSSRNTIVSSLLQYSINCFGLSKNMQQISSSSAATL